MVTLGPAAVVVVPFPFSDLSGAKLRPAIVMADAGRGDWLLCQVTSNPYSDPDALRVTEEDLQKGALTSEVSFARPIKLFTANESLMVKQVAILKSETFKTLLTFTIEALRKNMPK
jgi:mRNA interferase MazF